MHRKDTYLLLCAAVMVLSLQAQELPKKELPPPSTQRVDFRKDIEPILKKSCIGCHGSVMAASGLRLDNRQSALAGGYSGSVIKPGQSAVSRLIHLVAGLEEGKIMPLQGDRLSIEQVGLMRAWIDQGAEWPEDLVLSLSDDGTSRRQHWAFIPPKQPTPSEVRNQTWIRNPIDSFVLARLEAEKISPSAEADRAALIRRVSLDLIGLPPTPTEVADFLADQRPDAYERLVDRLLDSPHYGEKWARQWLDLARYADSDGYYIDKVRPNAWRYRHWVIDALNRNLPFDQFTIEQVAGDLLPNATVEQKVATGFHRNSLTNREGGVDREEFRMEAVVDRTSTIGTVWLGLTMGCARCHDHKYDPISQRDFYQLSAFFNTAMDVEIDAPLAGELGPFLRGKPEYDRKRKALLAEYKVPELQPDWEEKIRRAAAHPGVDVPYDVAWNAFQRLGYGAEAFVMIEPHRRTQKQQDLITDHFLEWYRIVVPKERYDELKFVELRQKLSDLAQEYPALTEAPTIAENPDPPKTRILLRGDYRQPGVEVQANTPGILPPLPTSSEPIRLRLARWLVSRENPLTARVTVNRMWQELFGRGLVESSQDFGSRGERPTHPELLDWLAAQFMETGWNLKKMCRLIVTSASYRQSSQARKDLETRDPYNRLLARQARLRLPAELIRDAALSVSDLLNPAIGGKSVRPPMPDGLVQLAITYNFGTRWNESAGPDRYRRGLYIFFQRTIPYPQLMTFDAADSLLACSRRERSTTPLQALNLLNDPVFFETAQGLAARVLREAPASLSARVDYAFQLCLARTPTPDEKERLEKYYRQQKETLDTKAKEALFPVRSLEGIDTEEAAVWTLVASVLLNLDDFITRG